MYKNINYFKQCYTAVAKPMLKTDNNIRLVITKTDNNIPMVITKTDNNIPMVITNSAVSLHFFNTGRHGNCPRDLIATNPRPTNPECPPN